MEQHVQPGSEFTFTDKNAAEAASGFDKLCKEKSDKIKPSHYRESV